MVAVVQDSTVPEDQEVMPVVVELLDMELKLEEIELPARTNNTGTKEEAMALSLSNSKQPKED